MRLVEKIGFDLGCLVDVSIDSALKTAIEHNYSAVEILGDESRSDLGFCGIWPWEDRIWDQIEPLLDSLQFKAYHAPYFSLNFLTLNPVLRNSALEQIKRSIDVAKEMGLDPVIIHPGQPRKDMDQRVVNLLLITYLEEVARYAEECQVKVAIESCEYFSDLFIFEHYLDKVTSQYLGICLDLNQEMVVLNQLDNKLLKNFIHRVSKKLFHVRFHGIDSEQIYGKLSYAEICKYLICANYEGTLIFRDVADIQVNNNQTNGLSYKVG